MRVDESVKQSCTVPSSAIFCDLAGKLSSPPPQRSTRLVLDRASPTLNNEMMLYFVVHIRIVT